MNLLRGLVAVAIGACATLHAWAAIDIAKEVTYTNGAAGLENCAWESAIAVPEKKRETVAASQSASDLALALEVIELKSLKGARKSEHQATVRANVSHNGKLVATQDFQERDSISNDKPLCDGLRAVGRSIGDAIADWLTKVEFMECSDACQGIHPDETIVMGAEALLSERDAISPTVRRDCRALPSLTNLLLKAFNEEVPAPRAKLEARKIDIEKYPGRRLVLRINNMHASGGGAMSGPKFLNISGELWDGTSKVATFTFNKWTLAGITTCRAVDSLVDAAAYTIADWLRMPTIDAKL